MRGGGRRKREGEREEARLALMVKLPSQGKVQGKGGKRVLGPCWLPAHLKKEPRADLLGSRTQRLSTLIPRLLKAGKAGKTHPAPLI